MIRTTLCYIEKNNQYLMLHRNKKSNDLNAQKWIGVGGKFQEGETVEECLIREVFEETNLTLTKFEYVGMIKFISDTWEDEDMYLFKGTDFEGELIEDCPEGTLKWVPAEEVLNLPTWEGDKYFIGPLLEGRTNLNMTVRYEGDTLVEVRDDTKEVLIDKAGNISSPHGFSTRIGGISDGVYASLNLGMNRGDDEARVTENWRRFLEASGINETKFVCGKQVHENHVHIATSEDARVAYGPGELIEADGYVTDVPNLPLVIFTADCVPIIMEDIKAGVIGAIHSGWRSTVADIEKSAIDAMLSLGASKADIQVAIGPAIEKCCFEVGREVIEAVVQLLFGDSLVLSEDMWYQKANGKYMLDLKGVVRERLIQIGIPYENIRMVGECTLCHPDKYFSHRYSEGNRGSLATVVMLRK